MIGDEFFFSYDSYVKGLHNIILAMEQHLTKLGDQMARLDRVIQPYKWSNKSASEIQNLFQEMNKTIDEAEEWMDTKRVLIEEELTPTFEEWLSKQNLTEEWVLKAMNREQLPFTKLKFQVPAEGPNKRMWEACSCFYIDKLTKAMHDNDKETYESAIFDLIDIGRAYDREMDGEAEATELLDDENRARKLYDDGFNKPMPTFFEEIIHGTPEEAARNVENRAWNARARALEKKNVFERGPSFIQK